MKKFFAKIIACALPLLLAVNLAFASISSEDAVNIVRSEYPDAQILEVEYEMEHGVEIYEVEFRTDTIRKGEFKINAATGEIISKKIKTHGH